MERIKSTSAVSLIPAVSSTGTAGYFRDPTDGVQTIVTNDWANGIQEELIAVIEDAGLTPNISDNKQLLKAIRTNTFSYETTTGSANAYVLTFTPAFTAYTEGMFFRAKIHAANTGASTVNLDTLGVKNIKLFGGVPLLAGELPLNYQAIFTYDGTDIILLNPPKIAFISSVNLVTPQVIGAGATALVNFDTVEEDPFLIWNNTTKRFIPVRLGCYRFSINLYGNTPGTVGDYLAALGKNGTPIRRLNEIPSPGAQDITLAGSTIARVTAGTDYFDLSFSNANLTDAISLGGSALLSSFQIEYLGT